MAKDTPSSSYNNAQQSGEVLTIVFTADNHLGYTAFGQQSRKREEREQRQRRAFQQATDFAIGQGVDLFIQAGDLFDSPTPEERDRSFVAERLAQLKQANIRAFALGGVRDTPVEAHSLAGEVAPAPQLSYASLGALQYFAPGLPKTHTLKPPEPPLIIRGMRIGICGLGVLAGQEGDPLASVRVDSSIELATIPLLLLHAPIEGFASGSSLLDTRALVRRSSIENQIDFRYILAGYHHSYRHVRIGQCEVIVAGATQHVSFNHADEVVPSLRDEAASSEEDRAAPAGEDKTAPAGEDNAPGFVFLGIAADGLRWCKHIEVDALRLRRLSIVTGELWSNSEELSIPSGNDALASSYTHPDGKEVPALNPTASILERLRPLCGMDTLVQLRLEGELTRSQYHQLDLNRIRRYGEEHCFALAIDDSGLSLLSDQESASVESGERFSPREELTMLVEEWITATSDEQEKRALEATKEELLAALDDVRGRRV